MGKQLPRKRALTLCTLPMVSMLSAHDSLLAFQRTMVPLPSCHDLGLTPIHNSSPTAPIPWTTLVSPIWMPASMVVRLELLSRSMRNISSFVAHWELLLCSE